MAGSFILFLLAGFFLPTIVGFFRWKSAGYVVCARRVLFFGLVNLFIGWTGIGWVACWFLLYSKKFEGYLDKFAGIMASPPGGGGAPYMPPPSGGQQPPGQQQRACGNCGGSGRATCPQCGGRASWYDPPTTANGVAQLNGCNYCGRSGAVQCMSCSGSGRSPY